MTRRLLLFDIDGTLVRGATAAHRDALHEALRTVHGIDPPSIPMSFDTAGRTDGEIARLILRAAGVGEEEIDAARDAVRVECCRLYDGAELADYESLVLPGVHQLLDALSARSTEFSLALVTGNFEPIARRKLGAAGVGGYFAEGQGAFGSDAEARAELPPLARARAGGPDGPFPAADTIVIGDTPRDIACARADGVRVVGLAGGIYSETELGDADAVVAGADGVLAALELL